jgi:pimeloyl-ACP methyl ester carboxylesterase
MPYRALSCPWSAYDHQRMDLGRDGAPERAGVETGLQEQQVRLPDGRMLRCVVAGRGDPLVVFEAGIGAGASMWVTVQRLVAEQTRTLAYDRAGYGGSDNDSQRRSLDRLAADLAAVLDAVEPNRPAVMVGSSLGAPILHLFAHAHPDRVAGLVLVDAAVGEILQQRQIRVIRTMLGVLAALSHVGLHRPLRRAMMRPVIVAMPPADRALLMRDLCAKRTVRMGAREARESLSWMPTLEQLLAGLPAVPVVAVVGERADRGEAKARAAMVDLFRREMRSHPRGRFVAASRSGHFIPWQEPALVADAIGQAVRTVRAATPDSPL